MKPLRECTNVKRGRIVKVEEKNKSFILKNPDNERIKVIRIDNCVFDANDPDLRCDFLMRPLTIDSDLFIELKGTEIEHAVNQIASTIQYIYSIDTGSAGRKRLGYIVGSRYPRDDGRYKSAVKNLRKVHQCKIKYRNKELTEDIENIV